MTGQHFAFQGAVSSATHVTKHIHTGVNVLPVYDDVVVAVRSAVLVDHAESVAYLVQHVV